MLLKSIIFSLLLAGAVLPPGHSRPNVLLIVTDDQRQDTIGAFGNSYIETPHLDRLARQGASFTRALTADPYCTPSRAEIMTGASTFQNRSSPFGKVMDSKMVFWASTMQKAGYQTWYTGKWMNDGSPKTRGYQVTSGLFSSGGGGGRDGQTYPTSHNGKKVTGYTGWTFKTNDGKVEIEKGVGLTPITDRHIADGAIAMLERRPTQPFFLHVNFTRSPRST
jgi:arylsulfatase A-like enzyme